MRRLIDSMLSLGAYPGESPVQRGKRRVLVGAVWLATIATIGTVVSDFAAGFDWVAIANLIFIFVAVVLLLSLGRFPHHFALIVNVLFVAGFAVGFVEAALLGGMLESGLSVLFGIIIVLGSLVALGERAALWWFGAFLVGIAFSALIPNWVDPIYVVEDPVPDIIFNLVATGLVVVAVMIYFVRQRDRLQKESDDLLHNILPDDVAAQLKASPGMIAESYDSASVLFADVVDFTPMSTEMTATELVALLNSVFSAFDALVDDLGLEKIKTVGDAYMVAAGIPIPRADHAAAIADLALLIRDELAGRRFDGREIRMRIGINSGPVVAGIVGTHKFAYDLWGDVVNTASRMESEGIGGSIQISESTYQLIRDEFVCEPRGPVVVKGKGEMETYLLISRRDPVEARPSHKV